MNEGVFASEFILGYNIYNVLKIGLAFLSGLLAAILMVPLNKYITIKIGAMSAKMMKYKDQRMRVS